MLSDDLKQTTQEAHQQLETKMDLLSRLHSVESYKKLLMKFYQYYVPLEAQLVRFPDDLPLEGRLKSTLLKYDLLALGFTDQEIQTLPAATTLPPVTSLSDAIGAFYVLEGSTMGGQVISKQLREKLSITPETGGSFFYAYGPQTMPMWLEFRTFLNSDETASKTERPKILESAKATFLSLERWVC